MKTLTTTLPCYIPSWFPSLLAYIYIYIYIYIYTHTYIHTYIHTQCVQNLRKWLVVTFTVSFLFQLQSHCNSSRCSVINFELSFFPSHVEEERLHAFRPLIIQVTFISLQCPVQQLHIPPGRGLNVSNKYCSAIL